MCPFGYGLSYTSFDYKDFKVSGGETITATFVVTNTGKVARADVPQVYLTAAAGERRMRLLGFERAELNPGASKTVTIKADPRLLARFNGKNGLSLQVLVYDRPIGCRRTVGPDARVDIMSALSETGPTPQPGGARKTAPVRPIRLVEQVLLADADPPVTVLRLPAVYGPGDAQHRLRPYLQRMLDGRLGILLHEGQAAWRWTRGCQELGYDERIPLDEALEHTIEWSGRRLMGSSH